MLYYSITTYVLTPAFLWLRDRCFYYIMNNQPNSDQLQCAYMILVFTYMKNHSAISQVISVVSLQFRMTKKTSSSRNCDTQGALTNSLNQVTHLAAEN